jgi:hypothetical protein
VCDRNRGRCAVIWSVQLVLLGLFCLPLASCGFPDRQSRRAETELSPGWPQPNRPFRQASLTAIRVRLPEIADAEYINDDELCMTCHQVYSETFQQNVHRGIHTEGQSCEACHGPASQHVITRGQEPGLLWDFKRMPPAQAAEVCLTCHEDNTCAPGANWRTSVHAHAGLSCTACHTGHYNVPPGTRATTEPGEVVRDERGAPFSLASYQKNRWVSARCGRCRTTWARWRRTSASVATAICRHRRWSPVRTRSAVPADSTAAPATIRTARSWSTRGRNYACSATNRARRRWRGIRPPTA